MKIKFLTSAKLLLVLFTLMLFGCGDDIDYIDDLAARYDESNDINIAYKAIDVFSKRSEGSVVQVAYYEALMREDEAQHLSDIASTAFSNKDYKIFFEINNILDISESDAEMEVISNNYHGKDGGINNLIAEWHIKKERVKSAFKRLEVASLDDRTYAGAIRFLLHKYGCMDTDSIWAELSKIQPTYMVNSYDIGGEKYPAIQTSYNDELIVKLRLKLRMGEFPQLQPDCPIQEFK